jgi:intracellular sulfur oxidation DsrE/DsrF family protein
MAAGAAALVVGRFSTAGAEILAASESRALDDAWIGKIKGKYRQVFDATAPNEGWGAAFPLNFIDSTKEAVKATDADITGITVFRHFAMPLMLNDATWAKYKIGEMLTVTDPKTKAPAVRNIFRDNVPLRTGLTYEQEMAKGVIFVACNLALTVISSMAAPKAGVSADQAKKEFTAGLLPGVYLAASGVYAVNRAQQAGCTYCYAG